MFINKILIIFLDVFAIGYCLNISETTSKIKRALDGYNNNRSRWKSLPEVDVFARRTAEFANRTQRFVDFLEHIDVEKCKGNRETNNDEVYVQNHILEGLLLHEDVPDWHWEEYKLVYNKLYVSLEHEMAAQQQWLQNLKQVVEHNLQYLAGTISYSLHLNHFGDLHNLDYYKKLLKLKFTFPLFDPAKDRRRKAYNEIKYRNVPTTMDWRRKGFKPRMEEQHDCGACYAFAVAHALQGQLYKKNGDWSELSPQQIIDCSFVDGNMGCQGGSLAATMRYVAREGLIRESYYPYIGKRGICHHNRLLGVARPHRWSTLPAGDEDSMEKALAFIGPLAVAVNAAPFTFQLYRSGIYDDPFCFSWKLNHAMLLVGYTQEYWVLLNWWGKNWGENGYIRIRRGLNRCGVSSLATYVEL